MRTSVLVAFACASLHALLVAAHLSLLAIWAYGAEHAIVFAPQIASSVQTYTSLVAQIIIVPYTALLVFLTQYVTLLSLLSGRNTLTSLQDAASAWTGLGSAVLTLWKQTKSPSYVVGPIQVTLYLISISCLHITTPSLFSVQSFQSSEFNAVVGMLGMPIFNASATAESLNAVWSQAVSFLQFQIDDAYLATLGLQENTIYDTIDLSPGMPIDASGELTAATSTANVTCGRIPNATATVLDSANVTRLHVESEYGNYRFAFQAVLPHFNGKTPVEGVGGGSRVWSLNDQIFTAGLQYASAWNVSGVSFPEGKSAGYLPTGRNALFLTVMNITDEVGHPFSVVEGNSSMPLQLVGCTLGWTKGTVVLDLATGQPVKGNDVTVGNDMQASAGIWEPTLYDSGDQSGFNADPEVDSWASMLFAAGSLTEWPADTITDTSDAASVDLTSTVGTISSQYMAQMMSEYSTVSPASFEYTLGQMTAAAYWASLHAVEQELQDGVSTANYTISSKGSWTMSQLNLNVVQIAIGLAASFLMFIIAASSSLRYIGSAPVIESFDPLRLIWFVATTRGVRDQLQKVDVPSTERLRQAGMFPLDPESMSVHVALAPVSPDYHEVDQDISDDYESKY